MMARKAWRTLQGEARGVALSFGAAITTMLVLGGLVLGRVIGASAWIGFLLIFGGAGSTFTLWKFVSLKDVNDSVARTKPGKD